MSSASFLDILSDWAVAIFGAITGAVGIIGGNYRRSKQNQRRLEGDDADPNNDGVLQVSKRNGEKIDRLEEKMDDQHSEVLDRVEDLADD